MIDHFRRQSADGNVNLSFFYHYDYDHYCDYYYDIHTYYTISYIVYMYVYIKSRKTTTITKSEANLCSSFRPSLPSPPPLTDPFCIYVFTVSLDVYVYAYAYCGSLVNDSQKYIYGKPIQLLLCYRLSYTLTQAKKKQKQKTK